MGVFICALADIYYNIFIYLNGISIIQPHSWCHVGDDNLTRVTLRSVNSDTFRYT
jgi:hypothetical protein